MNLFKYPIETLLGIAGVVALVAPIYSTMAVSTAPEKAQAAISAPQTEQAPPPVQATQPVQAPPAEALQQPKQAALTQDVWQPERATPAEIPKQLEKVLPPPPEKSQPLAKSKPSAKSRHAEIDEMVTTHAKANNVPEALVHRVIIRESRYQPDLIGRGGTIGLMQIKLATARGLGYGGDAEGLRDPDTNLAYGVKYLAGAYRVANGDHDLAVHYYAAGYYEAAKRWRLARYSQPLPILASTTRTETEPRETAAKQTELKEADAKETEKPVEAAKPQENDKPAAKPEPDAKPKQVAAKRKPVAAKPRGLARLFADAKAQILRPPADIPGGAKGAKPR
jgi:soluble lytic murein transglycosylase-like protein